MIIAQLSITDILSESYNLEPFVYASRPGAFTTAATFPAIFGWTVRQSSTPISTIEFLRKPVTKYAEQANYNDVVATEASWYFDSAAQIFYFHVEHDVSPLYDEFSQGLSYSYCSDRPIDIDGIPFNSLVKSVPDISQDQDITNYSVPSLINGTVELDNTEGLLDFVIDVDIYGNQINIFYLDDSPTIDSYDSSELVPLATLAVDDYDFTLSSLLIRVKDLREAGGSVLPIDLFSKDDYADLSDDLVGSPIPLAYGDIREIPLICTNGAATSGVVTYRAASIMTDFGTVKVKSGDVWSAVTPTASDLSTGELTLAEADARDGTTPLEAKLVDCSGIANTYATDVIEDLNYRAQGTLYLTSNYDTAEWEIERASLDPIGFYIGEQKKLYEIIADIQNGANVGFRYEINASGLRTIRIDSETRAPVRHVPNLFLEGRDKLAVSTDAEPLAGTVRVAYARSYVDDSTYKIVDDSEADTVLSMYRKSSIADLEVLSTASASASERGTQYIDRFAMIRPIFIDTILGSENLARRIFDILTVEITPSDFVDVDGGTIEGREYFGNKLIKLISVAPDLTNRKTAISGIIIGDAEFATQLLVETGGDTEYLSDDTGAILFAY